MTDPTSPTATYSSFIEFARNVATLIKNPKAPHPQYKEETEEEAAARLNAYKENIKEAIAHFNEKSKK